MLRIDIEDRHNNLGGCAVCCCEPVSLRAGEVRLVTLNYAPWTIPIMSNGGPGLVPTPEFSIAENNEGCNNSAIDGFAAPATTGLYFVTNQALALNTPLSYDLKDDVSPAGNTFEFRLVPVAGPYYGSLTTPLNGTEWVYTPESGFKGYDQFWVEITDAQGRKLIRPVNINVGAADTIPPKSWGQNAAIGVQIDRSKVKINSQMQTVSFPLYLPPSNDCETIDGCKRYRVTIKAYGADCENTYSHITCMDVRCGGC